MTLREDAEGAVHVAGLREVTVTSLAQLRVRAPSAVLLLPRLNVCTSGRRSS